MKVHYDEFETKPGIFPDVETIRYDCMLSSTQDKTSSLYLIPRRRDVSLTLSECADGVTRFIEPTVTLNMSGTTPPTQVTPGILESSLWTPLNNAVLDEVEIDDSDDFKTKYTFSIKWACGLSSLQLSYFGVQQYNVPISIALKPVGFIWVFFFMKIVFLVESLIIETRGRE